MKLEDEDENTEQDINDFEQRQNEFEQSVITLIPENDTYTDYNLRSIRIKLNNSSLDTQIKSMRYSS